MVKLTKEEQLKRMVYGSIVTALGNSPDVISVKTEITDDDLVDDYLLIRVNFVNREYQLSIKECPRESGVSNSQLQAEDRFRNKD